ncbi:MAG: hypothetical protein ACI86M_000998 [Saprospiraceae bacterium]|jgi:uncharacterized protein (TIRG00374 family)
MNKTLKSILKILMFLSIGVSILYIVYRKNNAKFIEDCLINGTPLSDCNLIDKILTDVGTANFTWIFIALGFYIWSNVARSIRWRMLIEPLGKMPRFANTLSTVLITHLVNLGIPRSGEFVRAGLLAKYEDLEAEKVMGTIVTSRIIDVLCLLVTIGITLILSFDNFAGYFQDSDLMGGKLSSLFSPLNIGILAIGSVIGLAALWKYRKVILATKIGNKVWNILLGFWEGILTIKDLRSPSRFIFHTVTIWVCYYLMTYLMFFSFAPTADMAPVAGLVVFVFGTLGVVIPSPGGMGTYQFLISEALVLYAIPSTEAFSFANIMFFSVQLCNIALGLIAFILLPIINRNE